jgi:hypothetical protein
MRFGLLKGSARKSFRLTGVATRVIARLGGVLLLIALLTPLVWFGLGSATHDGRWHQLWLSHVGYGFENGVIYPHWLASMNGGIGSPTMYYYPIVPYLFPSFVHEVLGIDVAHALAVGAAFTAVLAWSGMLLWLREFTSAIPSLLASTYYVVAPYPLAIDLYTRGAFAEYTAFAWLPFVLLGAAKLRNGDLWGLPLLASSYGLLIATHLPTTLVFSAVPVFYSLVPKQRDRTESGTTRWAPVVLCCLGMTLGAGLASPYLLPAMTMQDHVSFEAFLDLPVFKYYNNFFFGKAAFNQFEWGQELMRLLYLAFATTTITCLCAYWTYTRRTGESNRSIPIYFVAVAVACVFLMTPASDFVWAMLPKLQMIQFPWRICSVLTIASALLLAVALDSLTWPLTKNAIVPSYFLMITVLGGFLITSDTIINKAASAMRAQRAFDPGQIDAREYRPKWAKQDLSETIKALRTAKGTTGARGGISTNLAVVALPWNSERDLIGAQINRDQGDVKITRWKPGALQLSYECEGRSLIKVSQLYFPGWTAELNGRILPLKPSEPEGLIEIEAPAGGGSINVTLEPLWPERWGNRICLASGLIWMSLVGGLTHRRFRHASARSSAEI